MPKSVLEGFLAMLFLNAFLHRFFVVLGGGSDPQKSCSRLSETLIFTKSIFSKNIRKKFDLGSIFGGQSDEKLIKSSVDKHVFF